MTPVLTFAMTGRRIIMDLNQLRLEIDKIDDELVRLFVQRMDVSARIGDYKKAHTLPIIVPERELQKLQDVNR